jgi:arylsulfatase
MLIRKGLVMKTHKKINLLFFILAFTGSIVGLAFTENSFAKEVKKPNVVLMLADNLGYGDLSSYNGGIRGEMRTPNIDKLAAEGLRLTQFLVEPGCTPSRSALQTGRYSIRSGLSLVACDTRLSNH